MVDVSVMPATRGARGWAALGIVAGTLSFLIVTVVAIIDSDADAAAGVIAIPIIVLVTIPLARHLARIEGDPAIFTIVMAGLGVKIFGSLARYGFAFIASGGVADAAEYDDWGRKLAPLIRNLNFNLGQNGVIPGTGLPRVATGVVYALFGASSVMGFLVFAWFGFLGLLLFWRAFRIGVPDGDSRRYLLLVLFLPSLVFWPASIGKEAWMLLALGICAYGIACAVSHRPGVVALAPGLVMVTLVRPHVTLLVFCGFVFALLVRKAPVRNAATPALRLMALSAMLVIGVIAVSQATSFLGVEALTSEAVDEKLTLTESLTEQGGARFTPVRVESPLDVPLATVTVLFRPFPFEAHSAPSLIAAFEGVVMIALFVTSLRRLRGVRRRLRRQPYVAYALGFIVTFVLVFSAFSNFGLLARERTQMLPLLLVLLALPKVAREPATRRAEVGAARER